MVDDKTVNQVVDNGKGGQPAGYELPLLLFAGFRTLIDGLHAELRKQGHPNLRPAHGFAMQAIGPDGATAAEISRRLGVSKQAAGKTIDRLVTAGYAQREPDVVDARRKLVRLTRHGHDALRRSAIIFDRLRADWSHQLGEKRVSAMEDDLRSVVHPTAFRLDATGWLAD